MECKSNSYCLHWMLSLSLNGSLVSFFFTLFLRNYCMTFMWCTVFTHTVGVPCFTWSLSSFLIWQGSCNSKVIPYLEEELRRIYEREKTYREILWRNGIVKSSLMSPRIHPEYVGTEEVHVLPSLLLNWESSCDFLCWWYWILTTLVGSNMHHLSAIFVSFSCFL